MRHIYLIGFHWSWNFSSDVISNCLWAVSKPYIHIFSLQSCVRLWQGFWFSSYTCYHQFFEWLKGNSLKVLLLSPFKRYISRGRSIESKTSSVVVTVLWFKTVVGIRVAQRGTKCHWVNPFKKISNCTLDTYPNEYINL